MTQIERIDTSARSSRAVIFGDIVFVGGQTAIDRAQDIRGQTTQALERVDHYLREAGTDKGRVLSAQIWLRDIQRDFNAMNDVWDAWVAPGAAPARATAQCEMASPDILVEIIVTASV